MEREIVKTDKRYRRHLLTVYALCVLLGIVLFKWGVPAFSRHLATLPVKSRVETIERTIHLVLLLFIPAALYLIAVGRKVCRFQAMPYPGMKVIRDTVLVTGKRARIRGWSLIILGSLMITLVLASSFVTHRIILKMKQHPLLSPIFYGTPV